MSVTPFPARRLHPDDAALPSLPAGARLFALGETGGRLLTLPDVPTPLKVLVPRGHGWPILGVAEGEGLRGAVFGEACSTRRWSVAGGVALHLFEVPLPRGPAPVVAPARQEGVGGWLAVRLVNLPWSVARAHDAGAGHGLVAVAGRRVVGVSPAAREAGVARGMSRALARRRCPRLRFVSPGEEGVLGERVGAWLSGRFPGAVGGRTRLLPTAPMSTPEAGLAAGELLAREIWQRFGVEVVVVACADAEAARVACRWLPARYVGWAPGEVAAALRGWRRRGAFFRSPRAGSWSGSGRPDIEGVVEVARGLAVRLAPGTARVVVTVGTERGTLRLPLAGRGAATPSSVENTLRGALVGMGAVHAVRVRGRGRRARPVAAEPAAGQLALLPGVR